MESILWRFFGLAGLRPKLVKEARRSLKNIEESRLLNFCNVMAHKIDVCDVIPA